jgi:hypothetical protein
MFYNARWYDPALGRMAQADTIVPGGVQGLDRYAYVNNSPVMYTDPSGHLSRDQIMEFFGVETWSEVLALFELDGKYYSQWELLETLRRGEVGDAIYGCSGKRGGDTGHCSYIGNIVEGENGIAIINGASNNQEVSFDDIVKSRHMGFLLTPGESEGSETVLEFELNFSTGITSQLITSRGSHFEFDGDVKPFTLIMDGIGVLGGVMGMGWLGKSKTISRAAQLLSVTSSVSTFQGVSSAEDNDIIGGQIATQGALYGLGPGPIGLYGGLVVLFSDLFYWGP